MPSLIRSDKGAELIAEAVRTWIMAVGAKTAHIEPGGPWENGYVESFNVRLSDELLIGEIFYTLNAAQVVIEDWRRHYYHNFRIHRPTTDHQRQMSSFHCHDRTGSILLSVISRRHQHYHSWSAYGRP